MARQLGIRFRWIYVPLALYWACLFVGTHVPSQGGDGVKNLDKVVHFLAYLGLAFLLTWAWHQRRSLLASAAVVMAVTVCYAIIDELMQMFVPGRHADMWDILADVSGAMAGIGLFAVIAQAWSARAAEMQR